MTPRLFATALCLAIAAPPAAARPFDCVIEPKALVRIVASDRGRIDSIAVGRGDMVQAGDTLVQLESDVQKLQVDLYTARAASDVAVRAAEAEIARARRAFERAEELQNRNVGTVGAVEEAEVALSLAGLSLEQAIEAQRLTRIELDQARILLARRSISSPVTGVVTQVMAAPGEYAHEQLEIVELAEMDPLKVEVFVPADYWGRIAPGDRFAIQQRAPLSGEYLATVSVVDQVFDAASGTFGVRLSLPNPDRAIPAGTRCLVDFDIPQD